MWDVNTSLIVLIPSGQCRMQPITGWSKHDYIRVAHSPLLFGQHLHHHHIILEGPVSALHAQKIVVWPSLLDTGVCRCTAWPVSQSVDQSSKFKTAINVTHRIINEGFLIVLLADAQHSLSIQAVHSIL